ncbi:DUF4129 domain-containing protein [uncultured Lutibacter sp.]|uniref:DUF4129 domain-containing protein n=1 Tax=uncultured Lutibacter sp. TaxID=437739 RepID=UPI00262437D7|nr:DUF4129 domain-containing protein [uncultured Lutibacter sp.]
MNKVLVILFFMLLTFEAFAKQDSLVIKVIKRDTSIIVQKKFNQKALEAYKADKEFIYIEETNEVEPTWLDRLLNWLGRQFVKLLEWIFGVENASGIFAKILTSIPYIIAAILLFLIVKFFLKVNSKSIINTGTNSAIVNLTNEEELIKNQDLLKLIQQAIAQNNFRLAVRYSYLNMLKQLEQQKLIVWEQQKTNEDYIKEISKQSLKKSFKELTRLYDFVWYGNFEINELEFAKATANFEEVYKLIEKA